MKNLSPVLHNELKESYYGVADNIHQLVEKLNEAGLTKDSKLAEKMENLFNQIELGKYI